LALYGPRIKTVPGSDGIADGQPDGHVADREVKESLERQIENVASRFDAQAIRLDRAMLQTGARWTNRMIAWSEKVDVELGKRIQELGELSKRVEELDRGAK